MKHYLLLVLALLGLVAFLPTDSRAAVVVVVQPGYHTSYYQGHRHYYHHDYHRHYWHNY